MQSALKVFQFIPRTIFFWLPLIIIFIDYVFIGRFLRIAYVESLTINNSILALAVSLAGVWALPLSLGGLLAALVSLAITFQSLGLTTGLIATLVTLGVIWVGFKETDTEKDNEQDLTWQEWLAAAIAIIWAVLATWAVQKSLSGIIAGFVSGASAGAIAAIGVQIKSLSFNQTQNLQLVGFISILGLAIGFVHALLTFRLDALI